MMLLLRCPECKNTMKYQTRSESLSGKSKRCVYCGRSYQVRAALLKKLG